MARSTRSAATEHAYSRFAPPASRAGTRAARGNSVDEFDESDIWGSFDPATDLTADESPPDGTPPVPTARSGRKAKKKAAHGSLPVNIPDWSKILGDEYRSHHAAAASDWEADDVDDDDIDATTTTSDSTAVLVPPHELAWRRRRATSLSVHGHVDGMGMGIGRTLKVRDAVWKRTGFQA